MTELEKRRTVSAERLERVQDELADSESLAKGKACVYATGSFARGEASRHSDLDLFIVGKSTDEEGKPRSRILLRLDEICIKAELIAATRKLELPEFSGDGEHLTYYPVHDLTTSLGTPSDDATNTFTARLLLLLESVPLIEKNVYAEIIDEVVAPYWRDYKNHSDDFI